MHILSEHGPYVSSQDIKDEWVEHYINDWGAGYVARTLMTEEGLLPSVYRAERFW